MLRMNQEEEKNTLINKYNERRPQNASKSIFVEALAKRTGNH